MSEYVNCTIMLGPFSLSTSPPVSAMLDKAVPMFGVLMKRKSVRLIVLTSTLSENERVSCPVPKSASNPVNLGDCVSTT